MTTPRATKPRITPNDIRRGMVTRHFVKDLRTKRITEVDAGQMRDMARSPFHRTVSLPWIIGGVDEDAIMSDGSIARGARMQNEAIVAEFSRQMTGLDRALPDPLEFFAGTRYKQPPTFIPMVVPPVPVPVTPPVPIPPEPVDPLVRLTSGRLFAHAGADIAVENVEDAFDASQWIAQAGGVPVVSVVSNRLRFGSGGSSGSTTVRTYYLSSVEPRKNAMMFGRLTGWGNNNMLSMPNLRADTPSAARPASAIHAVVRNSAASESYRIVERSDNVNVQIVSGAALLATPAPFTIGLYAKDTVAASWATGSFGSPVRELSGIAMQADGRAGMTAANYAGTTSFTFDYSRINVHADNILRILSNVPIKVRLLDSNENVLVVQDSVSGTTDINLWTIRSTYAPDGVPTATKLQILDPVSSDVLEEIEPDERLWGGDVWQYTSS